LARILIVADQSRPLFESRGQSFTFSIAKIGIAKHHLLAYLVNQTIEKLTAISYIENAFYEPQLGIPEKKLSLLEAVLAIWGTTIGMASGLKDLRDYLNERVTLEDILTRLVADHFRYHIARLQHFCPDGDPQFVSNLFKESLASASLHVETRDQLASALLPLFKEAVNTPGATCDPEELVPIYETILNAAIRDMWKRISEYDQVANDVLLGQNEVQIEQISVLKSDLHQRLDGVSSDISQVGTRVESLSDQLRSFTSFALGTWQQSFDRLTHTAPPSQHSFQDEIYMNPFLLRRAEDFNHNYTLLARLFQFSAEWDSIQRKTDNVFIEAGRGTGKSMLLRRLTAQATVAAKRMDDPRATFDDAGQDYFGVYVKLTRGYYDQFLTLDTLPRQAGELMAQHELNLEIFDAFVETISWLVKERAFHLPPQSIDLLIKDLNSLFAKAARVDSLDDLKIVVRFEQDEIISYCRDRAFCSPGSYTGSARDTVSFMRQLSKIFRERIFPNRDVRLFLLIDEFETLLELQQVAINAVIKMRLNDLTTKVAVRTSGRKTSETFTTNDPIQDPRDYVNVALDYDVADTAYAELLKGIAAKRLKDAKYTDTNIESYLRPLREEVKPQALEEMLNKIWTSGRRTNQEMSSHFKQHFTMAAIYRILSETNKPKAFCGFDDYQLLSSGIVSNFIELCTYAFHFALADKISLVNNPSIPESLQTAAAYNVSKRLFGTIDGNVTNVGIILTELLSNLGSILRNRLLKHNSEPEANRLEVIDYNELSNGKYPLLEQVIDQAIVWSVFHEYIPGQGIRPKNSARPPGAQLIINRIYCPALGISPRARWRVRIHLRDLRNLLDPLHRTEAYSRLMRTLGSETPDDPQQGLFVAED
jgi:hypothetical protein